jgi:hypothetical protein
MRPRFLPVSICILFLLLGGGVGRALEISQGKIKLVIHEQFERFVPYLRTLSEGSGTEEWVPLLVDKDPRTSYVTLLVNNDTYRLGSIPGVRGRISKGAEGGMIQWILPDVEVKQTFSFLRSRESSESDAVRIVLDITNLKDTEVSVGVRYTLDTYLGEKSNTPFRTPQLPAITRETSFVPDSENWFLLSEDPERKVGLQLLLRGEGVSSVERVVLANWKRLSDTPWEYSVNPARTFTLLPYSINDSALALYYPVLPLKPKETRRLVTVLGSKGSGTYSVEGSSPTEGPVKIDLESILKASPEEGKPTDPRGRIRTELSRVEEFIDRISKRVADSTPISKEEIEAYRKVLEELAKRAKSQEAK